MESVWEDIRIRWAGFFTSIGDDGIHGRNESIDDGKKGEVVEGCSDEGPSWALAHTHLLGTGRGTSRLTSSGALTVFDLSLKLNLISMTCIVKNSPHLPRMGATVEYTARVVADQPNQTVSLIVDRTLHLIIGSSKRQGLPSAALAAAKGL